MLHVQQAGSVLTAVLDSPPANAIGAEELEALRALVQRVHADAGEIQVLVLRGGPRFFSGGVDISMLADAASRADGVDRVASFGRDLQAVLLEIEELPIPTIAAMAGSAVGGGLELALACDFRVVGAGSSYGLPESKLGLLPGAGGTQRLTEVAGRGTALRLILLGELVKGEEAVRLGIAQWAAPSADVDALADSLAARVVDLAPGALAASKRCISAARTRTGFAQEIEETRDLLTQADTKERLQLFLSGLRQK